MSEYSHCPLTDSSVYDTWMSLTSGRRSVVFFSLASCSCCSAAPRADETQIKLNLNSVGKSEDPGDETRMNLGKRFSHKTFIFCFCFSVKTLAFEIATIYINDETYFILSVSPENTINNIKQYVFSST